MNSRERYPPGIGVGRGGGVNANPNFQSRPAQQHYVQRNLVQNHHQFQQQQYQQHQQQQQWLRRNQLPGGNDSSIVDEVEKTVQSEAVDSRSLFISSPFLLLFVFMTKSFFYCILQRYLSWYFLNCRLFYTFWVFQITLGNNFRVWFSPELFIC